MSSGGKSYYERVLATLEGANDSQFFATVATLKKGVENLDFPYTTANEDVPLKLRDAAMENLIQWVESPLSVKDVRELLAYFKETGDEADARLFASLPLLKQFKPQTHGEKVCKTLRTLKLVTDNLKVGDVSLSDLKAWAVKLLSHPRGKKVLTDMVDTIDEGGFTLDGLTENSIRFISSEYGVELWGFSGIDKIYINIAALNGAHKEAISLGYWSSKDLEMYTKMLVAVIGFTEAAHCALRKVDDDAKDWKFSVIHQFYTHCSSRDPGVIAQTELFTKLLDWQLFSSSQESVREMFKYFDSSATEPPKISIQDVNFADPNEYRGIYVRNPTAKPSSDDDDE